MAHHRLRAAVATGGGGRRVNAPRPLQVLHVITRMIVGGAQENTLLSCSLIDRARFPSEILCGLETGAEGSLHDDCRAAGVPLHLEPTLVRRTHPVLDVRVVGRLAAFMRRGRYDVVHTHSSKAGIVGRWAARMARVPVVVHTAHGWPFSREDAAFTNRAWIALERLCAPMADAIVVVGTQDGERGLAAGIGRPGQYHLIRSGIDVEFYASPGASRESVRERLGVPRDALVVGTIGRLGRQKAPLDLLAAFERLARARPEAHLVMVGDGPQRAEVEAACARDGLASRVHLLGLRRDIPDLLHAFDVFALASHWEGLPRVLPQAMAAGLPIVATRVNGSPDAVTPDVNGWLVEVGDIAAMGDGLIRLADDPELARVMGARGRERVGEFSARRMVHQLSVLYAALAARKGLE